MDMDIGVIISNVTHSEKIIPCFSFSFVDQ